MKYKVIHRTDLSDLTKEINNQLEGGWKPQGGIGVHRSTHDGVNFYQAIILE